MDNIVLIGMPASGKSTVGAALAAKLGYGFVDSDRMIEGFERASLAQIIAQRGIEGFLAAEERVNAAIACDRCVIATGGSVVYCEQAMRHLTELGHIVYLRLSAKEICRRIPDLCARGVVMRASIHTVEELCAERIPLYERYAQYVIDCDAKPLEEIVQEIIAVLGVDR